MYNMEELEKQQESPEQQANKEAKKFDANIKKLVALFKGDTILKKRKATNSEINEVVEELVKEQKENIKKEFKEKASDLIKEKVEFDKFVIQKQKEFDSAIINKKKEFNKKMEDCFKLVDKLESIVADYTKTMEGMSDGK